MALDAGRPSPPSANRAAGRRARCSAVPDSATAGTEQSTAIPQPTVHVRFMLPLSVNFGDSIVLCGESAELGYWDPMKAPHFTWSWSGSSDVWILDVELPAESKTECKVVHITAAGEVIWEYTANRVLEIPSVETMRDGEVTLMWCDEVTDLVTPKILSSLASWDETDDSLEGGSVPFGGLFGFLSVEDDVIEEKVIEDAVVEEDVIKDVVIEEDVIDGEVIKDVVIEDATVEETAVEELQLEAVIADTIIEEPPLSKEAKNRKATATALKNVATAGAFLAGIGGAAALAGVAFDAAMVDTVR